MILLKDVSYEWEDGRTALKNINLEIKKGEFVLISGKSGSGKSTLGSVMNGLINPCCYPSHTNISRSECLYDLFCKLSHCNHSHFIICC